MDASNQVRKQPVIRGTHRRPDCSPSTHKPARSTECDQRTSGALTVAFRVIPLEGPDAEKLRERQLAVIVRLLRRATEAGIDGDAPPAAGQEARIGADEETLTP